MNIVASDNSLAAFAEAMEQATGFAQRWGHLVHYLGSVGADQINYGILDNVTFSGGETPVTFISTMDADWIAFYGEQRFDLHDPHVKFVREGHHAQYRWSEAVLPRLDDANERHVVAETVNAGLRSQIHMIAPDPLGVTGPIGGITIGSSLRPCDFFGSVEDRDLMLVSAAAIFHNLAIGEVRRQQVGARPLSARERDCMAYVAAGLRTARVAEKMGLSDATVEMHLKNARVKLCARTTPQAIARAMIFGDVSL